jgi:uracil-DNA glycosylase
MSFRQQLHPSWAKALEDLLPLLDSIEEALTDQIFLPARENVMRALSFDLNSARVVIFGQDPYPSAEHAVGLAFSIPTSARKIPPTLRNIFRELESDLGVDRSTNGDLSDWHEQGVVLLNTALTCQDGVSNSHANLGWLEITERCAQILGEKGVASILWGKNAEKLGRCFAAENLIISAHPSPLSSYRGFFGSKPFSRVNEILRSKGQPEIVWGEKNSALQS